MSQKSKWTGERLKPGIFSETTTEHLHRYAIAGKFVENKKVLDIACGEGYGTALLAKNALHVTGVDANEYVIAEAKRKYPRSNSYFFHGKIESIPAADGEFDIVVCFETIEHIADHDKAMQEIRRVMKPGGLLIISTPDRENYTIKPGHNNPFHVKELFRHEFEDLLKRYFNHYTLAGQQMVNGSVIVGSREPGVEMPGPRQGVGSWESGAGSQQSEIGSAGMMVYTGNFDAIENWKPNPLYWIAIASDQPVPAISDSLFNDQSVFYAAIEAQESNIRNTLSYRIGHTILWPAKMLKKLFTK